MRNSCLATLIAFLLVIFLNTFIIATQIRALSNPKFLLTIFKASEILTQVSQSVDAMAEAQRKEGKANLNSIALTKAIVLSIDPALLEAETNKTMTIFLDYVQGRSKTLDASINLVPWKKSFQEKWPVIAPATFKTEYEKLPPCPEGEAPQKTEDGQMIINCKSSSLTAEAVGESARAADLSEFFKIVPDQFSLNTFATQNKAVLERIRLGFSVLNLVFWVSLVLSILSVAGLVALGWPNFRAIAGWLGWIFVIVSALPLSLEIFSRKIIALLEGAFTAKLDPALSQIILTLLDNLAGQTVRATILVVAAIFGLGVILVILSFVLPKYEQKITPPGFEKSPHA